MKSEKGVTLISLIIYVIVMFIVVTIIGTVTSYFYENINNEYKQDANSEAELDMYLANDLKNRIITVGNSDDFESGNAQTLYITYEDYTSVNYTITDEGIYRNKVKVYSKTSNDIMNFSLSDIITDESNKKQILSLNKNGETFKSYVIYLK